MSTYSTLNIDDEQLTNDAGNPLDVLIVKLQGIKAEEQYQNYVIDVSFHNYTNILDAVHIQTIDEDNPSKITEVVGTMLYDPSDYKKNSLFADYPLMVTAHPTKYDTVPSRSMESFSVIKNQKTRKANVSTKTLSLIDAYSCNIDILSLFIDKETLRFEKRMEPSVAPLLMKQKSWENLPVLMIEVSVKRNPLNKHHHDVFKSANYMRMTMIGLYNIKISNVPDVQFNISTQMPLNSEENFDVFKFANGHTPRKTVTNSFIPEWESLKLKGGTFTKGDDELELANITTHNNTDINCEKYIKSKDNCVIWNSFHRTLMFGKTIDWFTNRIREQKWPVDLHVKSEATEKCFSFLLDLFPLLYPGESKLTLALTLQSISNRYSEESQELQRRVLSKQPSWLKTSQKHIKSVHSFKASDNDFLQLNGADGRDIIFIIDVTLLKPLQAVSIPPNIPESEINNMLVEFENQPQKKRVCTGRGLDQNWAKTVELAAVSLRRLSYYGTNDGLYKFQKQLAESRTRVEIVSSFCQDAARYINEHFVVNQFTQSKDSYDEFLLTAHISLMKEVQKSLIKTPQDKINPILRAARHSRQLQDLKHARRLYMQILPEDPNNSNIWRELSTCLKDLDMDWAYVCMQKALEIDSRHPLNILSMGCLALEVDIEEAEIFFEALIHLYPFHTTLWYITYCYYVKRSMFAVADKIMEFISLPKAETVCQELPFGKKWEDELGDWWDPTPIQIGINGLYEAADLLLRIRALTLADIALAQALKNNGENAAYFHLLALCCRLRGDMTEAQCHLQRGTEKYGQINYLLSLEAECLHKLGDLNGFMELIEKAGLDTGPFNLLLATQNRKYPQSKAVLIDLVTRQPSAYAWMALASDFMQNTESRDDKGRMENKLYVTECAIQALKIDRSFARAWALLANLTTINDRKKYFKEMAIFSGVRDQENAARYKTANICYKKCILRQECRCELLENIN